MANYAFSLKSLKYGTPTGTNTMPGSLTALPDTVKGSVTFDETEGSSVKFYVDQKKDPIKEVRTEEGSLVLTAQFYDISYINMAALKGGTGVTGGSAKFTPSTGFTNVELALEAVLDSGQTINIFNANCFARLTGGGGRDKMLALELKATSQLSDDLAGSWEFAGNMA